MYYYALGGYLVYKAYEYSSIIEYAISIGRGIQRVYKWVRPLEEKDEGEYLDWVLIVEDDDSPLKKNMGKDK